MTADAVVLGAGLAGMLAAAALARHPEIGAVTVVERDRLDAGPVSDGDDRRRAGTAPRQGLPQGRHAHVLMSSGVRAIEALLPGTTDRWLAAGAHRIGLPDGYVMHLPQGWLPRWRGEQFVISCSRGLLDWVVRQRLLELPEIRLISRTEAAGLCGDARAVTGARVRDRASGVERVLDAALVVDATGRGSRAPHWLAALGCPPVDEDIVDSGLRYATRLFRAPASLSAVVNVQADPAQDRPGQTAALMPIENGQWLVTLSGTRGGQPSRAPEEFVPFAAGMRHPIVAELIAGLEPLTPVAVTNGTANRRRHFDRSPDWPDGFVVLGDAVATYNPVYGHGMSVAALGATVLGAELSRRGLGLGLARAVQRRVAGSAAEAWGHATGTDIRFPDAIGRAPTRVERVLWRYQSRLMRTALDRPDVAREVIEVFTLSAPASRLLRPRVALATLRGPRRPPLDTPPFTPAERAALHLP
ncbi:pyridine nucleotide-disulfide oxidoreductase [Actinomycetes bacterium KLBMP 9797]